MPKQKVEIEVDVPEGLEATGEFRPPAVGEFFIDVSGRASQASVYYTQSRIILRRVKQYRDPVLPADAWKQCEFSDDEKTWFVRRLEGWVRSNRYIDEYGRGWARCRIEKEST